MGLDNINQQQAAIATNMAAAENLDKAIQSEYDKMSTETDNSSKVQESILKKALEGKAGNLGTQIVAKLAVKLAQNLPTNRILSNLKENYDFLLENQEESPSDLVNIRSGHSFVNKGQKQKGMNGQGGGGAFSGGDDGQPESGPSVREYVSAYSQMLVNGGSEIKKKVQQLESKLIEENKVPAKELQHVKSQVANSVRQEVLQQVKQAYLKQVLAKGKSVEWLIAKKEVGNFIDYAFLNEKLGGYDFGGLDGHLQGAVDKAKAQTLGELKEFVQDEMTNQVTKKALGIDEKSTEKEIESLLKLGSKVGFSVKKFVAQIPRLKDDLGLNPIIDFEYAPTDAQTGDQSRERRSYRYTAEEEKEVMTDKLRALYLKRAMYGDLRTVLETQFKMVKLKNGLIRLGVKNFDETEKEGKGLAKVKLVEMLREAFEERATYVKLAGPAWNMTERKLKTVLANLDRLGVSLTDQELSYVRDKANERMHAEAEHELSLIDTAIKARGEMKYLTTKKKVVTGILERLAGETAGLARPKIELTTFKEAC